MKSSVTLLLVVIGAILCQAEINAGSTTGQDVTTAEETKVTPGQDLGSVVKETRKEVPNLTKSPFSAEEALPKILPGIPIPDPDDDDGFPMNGTLPFEIEDGQKILEEKCREVGGEDAVLKATVARDNMLECAQNMVNYTELQSEIEANKANGELDTVFKKRVPRFKQCLVEFTDAVDPCLKEEEKVTKQFVQNVTDAMLSFICYKEGDRIALFIAEGGPECLQSKQQEVQDCLNSTFAKHLVNGMQNPDSLPLLVIDEPQCKEMTVLQECLVKSLETCQEPTPANIVESMINYLKKSSPCAQYLVESGSGNIVSPLAQTVISAFIVLVVLVYH
ncbi:hypothetical protein J437_LFUL008416 [Ladona fulva]|uniref:27 kDa hemolymph protein n=1 Tax=Ladona fulva TaxID=123851 RepID=A0A8K0K3B2_LADFU|nr:hypothetical protein J437_LFUL008416 [Ladona fulva]